MASTVSTRPGIRVRVPVKYPAKIEGELPIIVRKEGGRVIVSLDGGGVSVWQLQSALASVGKYFDVENNAAFEAQPTNPLYLAWRGGGRTKTGDTMYDAIVTAIGQVAADNAYAAALSVSL